MEIYIQDQNTGRVIKSTERALKILGPNWRRVATPKMQPPKTAEVKTAVEVKEPVKEVKTPVEEVKREMTREDYIEAIRATGAKLKGLHLYSLDKLKETYEAENQKDG